MADKQIVDARGLSCPQPVLMTKKHWKLPLPQNALKSL